MNLLDKIKNPNDLKKYSIKELNILSNEIREFLIQNISKTGGHLASNLGIVELTIALLKNYDFTKDKIIFDVGHQSYVYKILTDRKEKFNTIRKYKGISGFPKREESKYDFFDTGHSSNSISACIGLARARDLQKQNYEIISVIGDGSFTGGMVYEALNDLGYKHSKVLIILNDNQMSISNNVGGLSKCLNKVRLTNSYNKLKERVHYKLDKKKSQIIIDLAHKLKNSFKSLFFNPMFFENLGVKYVGPIDGNNLKELDKVIRKIKKINAPVVLHIKTTKGLGYLPALINPDKFHAVSKFDIETGHPISNNVLTYSKSFGNSLVELAKKDDKIVAITAAMCDGTGLSDFKKIFPDRTFDVGIAEEHAVTLAAGMKLGGLKPVFAVYSTFLQRSFDQLLIDICMQKIPVVFAIDRAGIVGNDGKTHQGVFDLSYLNLMPNIEIIAPKCVEEIYYILEYAFKQNNPVAIRYPRGGDVYNLKPIKEIEKGKWEKIKTGEKVIILSTGKMVGHVMKTLENVNFNPTVINSLFVKPLDKKILKEIVNKNYNVLTIEDNNIIGGFGEQVLYELQKLGFNKKIKIMGYQDNFIDHGNVEELFRQEKVDSESIIKNLNELYEVE